MSWLKNLAVLSPWALGRGRHRVLKLENAEEGKWLKPNVSHGQKVL